MNTLLTNLGYFLMVVFAIASIVAFVFCVGKILEKTQEEDDGRGGSDSNV